MNPEDIKEGGIVRASFSFTREDLDAALDWARKKHYTYERDGEIAGLLFDAALAGVFEPGIEDAEIEEVD